MTEGPATTPLAEASPTALDELFSRDPLLLTQQDISRIVTSLREARARWQEAEAAGKTRAPKVKAAAGPVITDLSELDL